MPPKFTCSRSGRYSRRSATGRTAVQPALTTDEILKEIRRLRAASSDLYRQLIERAHEERTAKGAA
jgi:hypothetical protein